MDICLIVSIGLLGLCMGAIIGLGMELTDTYFKIANERMKQN